MTKFIGRLSLLTTFLLCIAISIWAQPDSTYWVAKERTQGSLSTPQKNTLTLGQTTSPSQATNEVRSDRIQIQANSVSVRGEVSSSREKIDQIYIRSAKDVQHVDSLYVDFKKAVGETVSLAVSDITEKELQYRKLDKYEWAATCMPIPLSIPIWLILFLIARRSEDKLLITISSILLTCSIIGSFAVLPTILYGFNWVPF